MAYGTPARPEDIEPYYTDIRRGSPPPTDLLAELTERYQAVGGTTPLLEITARQAEALGEALGSDFRVFVGMKHWKPWIRDAVADMKAAGIRRAVGIVLAPHFSRGSIAEYAQRIEAAKQALEYDLDITVVPSWHLNDQYLDAVASHIRDALNAHGWAAEEIHVVFTAHSLPIRVVSDGDPYQIQLNETTQEVARRLSLPTSAWSFSFQSAGRTADPWLGPDLTETVNELAAQGEKRILVAPIGFVSDHLEILFDIDIEAREAAAKRDVQLERMESLNDDPGLIAGLADIARG
jgi:ferrochelatase